MPQRVKSIPKMVRNKKTSAEALRFTAASFDEPELLFSSGYRHVNPKVGIPLHGPRSLGSPRHKNEVHIGFIGTGDSVEVVQKYLEACTLGVAGESYHYSFPGCTHDLGFRTEVRMSSALIEKLTHKEITDLVGIEHQKERFEEALGLLMTKMELLCNRDHPLDYVMVVLTEDLYNKLRVAEYQDDTGMVHRDLRRALKARAMRLKKPTQIFRDTTTDMVPSNRPLEKSATRAWNLFTAMYFKGGGLPWGPIGINPSTCYIGVSFYRPLGESSQVRSSVVRAFDEHGEGLVLRGQKFDWNEEELGKSPHLPREHAAKLVEAALELYQRERHQLPVRVIVHKSSRFERDERAGFESALSKVSEYDLVSVSPISDVRLLRTGKYPPLRGTVLKIEQERYLYTTGYIPSIQAYPHGHVPSPLRIVDHVGDTPLDEILREILILTKMNWNSANMDGLMPITLTFSRAVGDIIREIPDDVEPETKYIYYM